MNDEARVVNLFTSSCNDRRGGATKRDQKIQSSNKGKEKITEPLEQPTDMWENQVRPHAKETNAQFKGKAPMDGFCVALQGPKTKGSKKRERKKIVARPSNATEIGPQDIVDAGRHFNPSKRTLSTWFILAPSSDAIGKESLQSLPEPNVNIIMEREAHANVSILMNNIASQLHLGSPDEVAIFMKGNLLSPQMELLDVLKQWMTFVGSDRKTCLIGSSAEDFCMKLTYARREW